MTQVDVEKKDQVAFICFHRPEALNALNPETFLELEKIWAELESHPKIRSVILSGDGDKAFIAGADVVALSRMGQREASSFLAIANRVLDKIEASSLLSIACVKGFALGGGLELALAADFIFAGNRAILGFPEVHLGLIPGFGAFKRLPQRVGMQAAKKLLMLGDKFKAEEAEKMGLVDRLLDEDQLLEITLKFLEEAMKCPPTLLSTIKRGLQYPDEADHLFLASLNSEEAKQKMDRFLERKGKGHVDARSSK